MLSSWHRLRLVTLTVLVILGCSCISLLAAVDLQAPLPVDPAVYRGRLDNGLTYWIRTHTTPPGKVAFWMHVHTGSINEADGQEGIAHYLEHMAFNGTHHFPPGELINYFESIGLRFGQHQNAFTSFNQTTYLITLPDTQADTIDKGVLFLSDVAFRMLLTDEEIDKERRVILEEKRARKGVHQRLNEKLLPAILPGSRLARRLPIGLEETIKGLKRQAFLDYYHTWYHPAKVTLLAVGDAPVETIEAAIVKHFAGWKRDDPMPEDQAYGITPYTQQQAVVVSDPELTTASVEMLGMQPHRALYTGADLRRRLVENLGTWIMRRRLQQLIQEGKASYQSARVYRSSLFGAAVQFSAEVEAEPEHWSSALKGLLVEIQRARLHGFTDQEVTDARKAILAAAEQDAQTESTWDASAFLRRMNQSVARGRQPRSAAQTLQLWRDLLPGITSAEVSDVFAIQFEPGNKTYILSLPENDALKAPSHGDVLALVNDALATPVNPWQATPPPTSLLDQMPQPGTIVEQTPFAPFDIVHVTFANHVRLHYRFMDFKKDHVTVRITLPGGKIRESPANRGITNLALQALLRPATGRFSSTDILDFMTGKKVSLSAYMSEDALILNVSGTPDALEDGLQLVHLLLQDARLETPVVALWKHRRLQGLEAFKTRIDARVREIAALTLSGQDPRQGMLTAEQVKARADTIAQAQTWLNRILHTAPMEVAMVGDMAQDQALRLAATYLGSLPARRRDDPSLAALRQVPGFTGPRSEALQVDTITPRAHLMLMWRCADWHDVRGRRLINLVARILERRLRQEVREERGLTYSTSVYTRSSKVYPQLSALYVEFTTAPDTIVEAVQAARSVVETFAQEGPSMEEIDTVRKQLKNAVEATLERPRFWVDLLADLEYHGTRLDDIHGLLDQIMSFTQADIAAEARKVVVPERFAMVTGRPQGPGVPHESRLQHPPLPTGATP